MPLNDTDKTWVREAIREGNKSTLEKFKDWIPAAVAVGLLIFAWNKNEDYTQFKVTTGLRLEGVEKSLARQNLTSNAALSTDAFASNLPQLEADIKAASEKKVNVSSGVLKDLSQKLLATDNSAQGYWPRPFNLLITSTALPRVLPHFQIA